MKFFIEQVALCPNDPVAAKELLTAMGAVTWHEDHVEAEGHVFGCYSCPEADLSFNYDILGAKELEILSYSTSDNWIDAGRRQNTVSHLGMHCTAEELVQWRGFFEKRGIAVAQEVITRSHTNPAIAGKREYNYVIFDTKHILGVDVKFIVRIMK
jgi:hypothetical protein